MQLLAQDDVGEEGEGGGLFGGVDASTDVAEQAERAERRQERHRRRVEELLKEGVSLQVVRDAYSRAVRARMQTDSFFPASSAQASKSANAVLRDEDGRGRARLDAAREWHRGTGLPLSCFVLNGRVDTGVLNMQRQIMQLTF